MSVRLTYSRVSISLERGAVGHPQGFCFLVAPAGLTRQPCPKFRMARAMLPDFTDPFGPLHAAKFMSGGVSLTVSEPSLERTATRLPAPHGSTSLEIQSFTMNEPIVILLNTSRVRTRPTAIEYEPEDDENKAESLAGDDGAFGRVGAGFDGKYKDSAGESDDPESRGAHDGDESEDG